jgi:hypothetical protein
VNLSVRARRWHHAQIRKINIFGFTEGEFRAPFDRRTVMGRMPPKYRDIVIF